MNLKKAKTIEDVRAICAIWAKRSNQLQQYAANTENTENKRLKAYYMALFYFNRVHILTIRAITQQLKAAVAGNIKPQFESGGITSPNKTGIITGNEKIISPKKTKIITDLRKL